MFELHAPRIFGGLLMGAAALSGLSSAQAQTPEFYAGKTIDLVIGYSAGGGYDAYARLIARHLGNHLPGKPTVVPRNMPGGGGRVVGGFMAVSYTHLRANET